MFLIGLIFGHKSNQLVFQQFYRTFRVIAYWNNGWTQTKHNWIRIDYKAQDIPIVLLNRMKLSMNKYINTRVKIRSYSQMYYSQIHARNADKSKFISMWNSRISTSEIINHESLISVDFFNTRKYISVNTDSELYRILNKFAYVHLGENSFCI